MLRGQGMLKSRCCVLFSDLKVFLLGPQAPTKPMSGETARISPYASDNNNTLRAHRLRHWSTPSTEDPVGPEEAADGSGWTGPAAEEFPKDRRDDRFSFISYAEGTPVCRICFQGPEQGELLSPCRCSGSIRSTHQPCLIKWISERGSWTCELCYYKYQVIAISTKNPLQWQAISLTVIEKVQIAAAILGSLFLIASISWLVWSSLSPSAKWQRQDLLFQICYGMYGFMDVVCIALIVHEGPSVFRIFHRWQAVNQQWKVLNYDKKRDSEELKKNLLLHQREPAGADDSPSPSSLMAAAGTPALDVTGGTTNTNITAAAQDSYQTDTLADGPALPDQHCPYNLLHLLSHLRPHEARSPTSNISTNTTKPREVVMRVTTV
ncbi:E3 ubiquitin-protein ligase MARCH4-like [Sinocyclocheilus grahami]|uniref:RING-type E3 ubiquitin transferase n=1 Tax=Sinocyclocheilus grahami TaxID=75366 RepID=A0A672QUQ5_SINGR|nr:PREDICTED: E3 ubiquitin-protein ligase MARCH4-like [Sinocyclocheilus grahami]